MKRAATKEARLEERGKLTKAYRAAVRRDLASAREASAAFDQFAADVRTLVADELVEASARLGGEPVSVRSAALRLVGLRFDQLRRSQGREPLDDYFGGIFGGDPDDGWAKCRGYLSKPPTPATSAPKKGSNAMITLSVQITSAEDLKAVPGLLAGLGSTLLGATPGQAPANLAAPATTTEATKAAPAAAPAEPEDDGKPFRGKNAERVADDLIADGLTSGPLFDRLPQVQKDRVLLEVDGDNVKPEGAKSEESVDDLLGDGPEVPTVEAMREKLGEVATAHGPAKLKEIILAVGASNASGIAEGRRAEVIRLCDEALG